MMSCRTRSTWARRRLLCLTLLAMSGCAAALTAPVSSYCAIAKPISYDSRADTSVTVAAVQAHNSKWLCVCEADCPASIANTR